MISLKKECFLLFENSQKNEKQKMKEYQTEDLKKLVASTTEHLEEVFVEKKILEDYVKYVLHQILKNLNELKKMIELDGVAFDPSLYEDLFGLNLKSFLTLG